MTRRPASNWPPGPFGHTFAAWLPTGRVAAVLGIPDTDIQLIELGAELRDIGKIGVRESVLQKPSRLSDEAYRHLMEPTVVGARILEPLLKHAPRVLSSPTH